MYIYINDSVQVQAHGLVFQKRCSSQRGLPDSWTKIAHMCSTQCSIDQLRMVYIYINTSHNLSYIYIGSFSYSYYTCMDDVFLETVLGVREHYSVEESTTSYIYIYIFRAWLIQWNAYISISIYMYINDVCVCKVKRGSHVCKVIEVLRVQIYEWGPSYPMIRKKLDSSSFSVNCPIIINQLSHRTIVTPYWVLYLSTRRG